MNAYELTKDFFDKEKITYNCNEDENNNLISLRQSIGNTGIVSYAYVIFPKNAESYSIYVNNFATAEPGTSQVTQMIEVCNEFNRSTTFVKMYVEESGTVEIAINKFFKDFEPEDVLGDLLYIFNTIEEKYINRFMKIKWS